MNRMEMDYDIIIIGAGLVGLTAALACASKGVTIALIDSVHPGQARADGRASAIAASSYRLLENLGIKDALFDKTQPISDMLIADGGIDHVSPLTLHFDGEAINGPTGYMIENDFLRGALLSAVEAHDDIDLLAPREFVESQRTVAGVTVSFIDQTKITGYLLVAADGRNSALRKSAGIGVSNHNYSQKALVTTFCHEFPHDAVAHQIFFPGGPLALLPLTENRMSIVWSDKAGAIDAAFVLTEEAFLAELHRRIGGLLGQMFLCAPRQVFPLSLQMADSYTQNRLALIGDAAHAIHPLAGQGLNMGFRDGAALADVVFKARSVGLDIGGTDLDDYAVWRNFDNQMLAMSTNILNALFSNNFAPLKHARRLGLTALNRTQALKTVFMKEASGQLGDLPSLLR